MSTFNLHKINVALTCRVRGYTMLGSRDLSKAGTSHGEEATGGQAEGRPETGNLHDQVAVEVSRSSPRGRRRRNAVDGRCADSDGSGRIREEGARSRDRAQEREVAMNQSVQAPAWLPKVDVKAIVRHRDGYACTECGMTAEGNFRRYGRNLDVHRVTPGSLYTVDGCVTVCRSCHGDKPRRRPGEGDGGFFVRIPATHGDGVRVLAQKARRSVTSIIQEALEIHLTNNDLWPPAEARGK